ncbi:MAG: hypothetical protein LBV27_06420 [Oscillospiraceae bacterium]|nr:hypothetical protein [Oscillospiraceae bacterium]
MNFVRGIMLEGISCAGKTSTFNEVKKLHTETPNCERSIIALGEHYSQVLNRMNGVPVRMEQDAHLALLGERLSMMEQLNAWACSLGEGRRQSRGIFALLERFYLNHVAAFDMLSRSIEERCLQLGLKCVLLIISDENIANRIRLRDDQMKIHRPVNDVEKQASDYLVDQGRFLMAAERISIPTLIINTDSMDWISFAHQILSFSDCT